MFKFISLLLVCAYFSPVQSCDLCKRTNFCLKNGAVYDGESQQACMLLGRAEENYRKAKKTCKKFYKGAYLWEPTNKIAKSLADLYPSQLRSGSLTSTWVKLGPSLVGEISGDGNSVAVAPNTAGDSRNHIICCVDNFQKFDNKKSRRKFQKKTRRLLPGKPRDNYCTRNTSSNITILPSVSVFETNSELDSFPVTNLFNREENSIFKSEVDPVNPTFIIQYFQTKNTVNMITIQSSENLPSTFKIYGGTVFNGESNIPGDYELIGDQDKDENSDPKVFKMTLNDYNCYSFVILYFPELTSDDQLCLYDYCIMVAPNGRPLSSSVAP